MDVPTSGIRGFASTVRSVVRETRRGNVSPLAGSIAYRAFVFRGLDAAFPETHGAVGGAPSSTS